MESHFCLILLQNSCCNAQTSTTRGAVCHRCGICSSKARTAHPPIPTNPPARRHGRSCATAFSPRSPPARFRKVSRSRWTASRCARPRAACWLRRGPRLPMPCAPNGMRRARPSIPARMPLTRLANSIIDGVAERRDEVAADVLKYLGSDLLFYRADGPAGSGCQAGRGMGPGRSLGGRRAWGALRAGGGDRACAPARPRHRRGTRGDPCRTPGSSARCIRSRR